jgi:MFS family permease
MFRHLARAAHPLLDLSVFRVQTFDLCNGNVSLVFRATISATPFLLPLMLQLAWGLNPLAAGSYVMIYFLGNVAMKPFTSPLLRRLGFRSTLVGNGLLSGAVTIACGFVSPQLAFWLAAPILFLTGLTRSMQFTALNTLGIADITPAQKSSGNTLYSMLLQVSFAAGVAMAALVLQKSAWLAGHSPPALSDFRIAFAVAGLAAIASALFYLRLPRNAGAELLR